MAGYDFDEDRAESLAARANAGDVASNIGMTVGTALGGQALKAVGTNIAAKAAFAGATKAVAAGTASAAQAGLAASGAASTVPVAGWVVGALIAIGTGIGTAAKAGQRKRDLADMQANAGIAAIEEARTQAQRDFNVQVSDTDFALREKRDIYDEDKKELQKASGKKKAKIDLGLDLLEEQTSMARQSRQRDINAQLREQKLADLEAF